MPASSLSVLHFGEVHSSRDLAPRDLTSAFALLYIPAQLMRNAMIDWTGQMRSAEPYFSNPVSIDPRAVAAFITVWKTWADRSASRLERDSALQAALATLFATSGTQTPTAKVSSRRRQEAVERARRYVEEHFVSDISIETLAEISGLSRFHLVRRFRDQIGLPPHKFQTQLRIACAQKLIAQGSGLAAAAASVGFADQSHMGRHFRRLIRMSPGQYRESAITFYTAQERVK